MSRYIDADGLKIEFMNLELDHCQGTDYREANQVIDDYPTADVTDVKHGHWTDDDTCSVCGALGEYAKDIYHEDYYFNYSPYCSHCGARMDEEV